MTLRLMGSFLSFLNAYHAWHRAETYDVFSQLFLALVGVCLFSLTNTKIDADEQGIRVTAPHGVYAMDWSEVKAVNHRDFTVVLAAYVVELIQFERFILRRTATQRGSE